MEPRRFRASELAQVIRSHASYSAIMAKYSLTETQLDAVFTKLIEKGVVRPEELPKQQEVCSEALPETISRATDQPLTGEAARIELDRVQLRHLLKGTWGKVSDDFVTKLLNAIKVNDRGAVKRGLDNLPGLGPQLIEALARWPEAVYSNLILKAESCRTLRATGARIKAAKGLRGEYRENMVKAKAQQVKNFAYSYPDRILHPEIIRQLAYLHEAKSLDALQILTINEQLDVALASSDEYWAGISDVKAARAWHGAGVKVARLNKIKVGQVAGPLDDNTCPVCAILLGLQVDFANLQDKFDADAEIEDPDEYAAAWSFPRIGDVDNISREDLAKKFVDEGWAPPFHVHCRHSIAWLYGET
jgi:hypothetical protein